MAKNKPAKRLSYESILAAFDLLWRNHRFFSVTFIKRSDGSLRTYHKAQCGVKKHLAGGEPVYDFREKKLISCFVHDPDTADYRVIPLEGIISINVDGQKYVPKEEDVP